MSKDNKNVFVIEVGVEDLPSIFVKEGKEKLMEVLVKLFAELRLRYSSIKIYSTPRRLIGVVEGINGRQPDVVEEKLGPKYEIAFTPSGKPTVSAIGFARRYNVSISKLYVKETTKGKNIACKVRIKGDRAEDAISKMILDIFNDMSFGKTMYWNETRFAFPRPIRWLLCLFNNKVLNVSIAGVRSSNITYSHRVLFDNKKIKVRSASEFLARLSSSCVIYDHSDRMRLAKERIEKVLDKDERIELLSELDRIVDTLENPTTVIGSFDEKFLSLPDEIIKAALMGYQNFFPVSSKSTGRLKNKFVALHDSLSSASDSIVKGYERAIIPRLRDASFFVSEDIKTGIDSYAKMLEGIVFIDGLGKHSSVLDKARRITELSEFIRGRINRDINIDNMRDACRLCKADLSSLLIQEKEFSHLQGVVGMYYARACGYNEEVALAISEHYLPRTFKDNPPKTDLGRLLSIADKIDSIVSAFICNLKPTGSEDPFAVRRQALGIISTLLSVRSSNNDNEIIGTDPWNVSLIDTVDKSISLFPSLNISEDVKYEVVDYISDRLKVFLRSSGIRYDIAEAGIGDVLDDIAIAVRRADALQRFWNDMVSSSKFGERSFYDLIIAFKRVMNIVKQGRERNIIWKRFSKDIMKEKVEKELYNKLIEIRQVVLKFVESNNYYSSLMILSHLKPYVDSFFDNVLVMCDDENLRSNRLALMNEISDVFLKVADFTKIVVEEI
ncbi:MAG: glycine--tRNA ligase subunit beta [bacterium]